MQTAEEALRRRIRRYIAILHHACMKNTQEQDSKQQAEKRLRRDCVVPAACTVGDDELEAIDFITYGCWC